MKYSKEIQEMVKNVYGEFSEEYALALLGSKALKTLMEIDLSRRQNHVQTNVMEHNVEPTISQQNIAYVEMAGRDFETSVETRQSTLASIEVEEKQHYWDTQEFEL